MLNHSTADTSWNDPSGLQLIRLIRPEKYSRTLGANRFAVQSADPSEFDLADAVSNYEADDKILRWIARHSTVFVARGVVRRSGAVGCLIAGPSRS